MGWTRQEERGEGGARARRLCVGGAADLQQRGRRAEGVQAPGGERVQSGAPLQGTLAEGRLRGPCRERRAAHRPAASGSSRVRLGGCGGGGCHSPRSPSPGARFRPLGCGGGGWARHRRLDGRGSSRSGERRGWGEEKDQGRSRGDLAWRSKPQDHLGRTSVQGHMGEGRCGMDLRQAPQRGLQEVGWRGEAGG